MKQNLEPASMRSSRANADQGYGETLRPEDTVQVAVVERSGFVESRHLGAAVLLSPDGAVLETLGNPEGLVLPRSCIKPFFAVGSVRAGAQLTDEQLVIAAASHSGTERHSELVRSILEHVGLRESSLECPPSWPEDSGALHRRIVDGGLPRAIDMTCSGKHAAMLSACVASGWDPNGYTHPTHPLQRALRDELESFIGGTVAFSAVDGCGAPVYAMSLLQLATGIHRFGRPVEQSAASSTRIAARLVECIRKAPWAIGGGGTQDSTILETLGVVSKYGAEGLHIMLAPDGTSVAVKTLDGSRRASALVGLTLLAKTHAVKGVELEKLKDKLQLEVFGGGRIVGSIKTTIEYV